jgi:YbbR domain-containing protein
MKIQLWRGITRNLGLKCFSLVLAALLWLAMAGAPEVVTIQSVPLLYRNLRGDLILASETPGTVRVELRGASAKLTQSALSDVFAALDLSQEGPGERTFTLSSAEFSLPRGITFLHAVPAQVRLQIYKIKSKDVPVKVRLTGAPPAGYRIAGQEVAPPVLRISGPEPRMEGIGGAETDLIDVSAMTGETLVRTNAFVEDPRVQFESPPVVVVKLAVERIGGEP